MTRQFVILTQMFSVKIRQYINLTQQDSLLTRVSASYCCVSALDCFDSLLDSYHSSINCCVSKIDTLCFSMVAVVMSRNETSFKVDSPHRDPSCLPAFGGTGGKTTAEGDFWVRMEGVDFVLRANVSLCGRCVDEMTKTKTATVKFVETY